MMLKNLIAVGVFSVVALQTNAVLINVDFNGANSSAPSSSGTMSGAAAVGSAGDVWNGVSYTGAGGDGGTSALVDSTGAGTSATLTVDGTNLNGSWDNNILAATDAVALTADYINLNDADADGTTVDVTIAGLDANAAFTLVIYGVGDAANQNGDFAVDQAVEGPQATTGASATPLATPQHYVTFTGTTSASGEINIDFIKQGTWSAFNGFQLDVVPEPSSLALLGLTGLCVLRRRRG